MRTRPTRASGLSLYALIFFISFVVYAIVAWPHTHPPYMDSFYYVDIARNVAHGQGLTEGFVWNYLAGMPPLRHPSSAYWLPGLSLLLAPVLAMGGGYRGAALLTCAVAALCPLLAARIGLDIFGTRRHALTMAGLTLFNGLWFHDWTTPDAFVLYAALATLTLLLAYMGLQGRGPRSGQVTFALAGAAAGLAALTRQEGVLLLVALVLCALISRRRRSWLWPHGALAAIAAFALVELPWVWHNLAVAGTPFPASSSRALWMRAYDAFYALHSSALTPRSYLSWGLANLIGARVDAVLFMVTIWAALWLVVLAPPLLLGLWRLRGRLEMRPFLVYWALLALAMPLVFTATLRNGTLLHASGALLPFASGLIVGGLDVLGPALARLRRSNGARLARDMGIIAVGLAALVSLGMAWRTFPAHGDEYTRDQAVVAWLRRYNVAGRPVMVLDPPAFAYLDDGPYVVTPSDGVAAALAVARHYGAAYWALDPIHAASLDALYAGQVDAPGLRRVAVVDGVRMYKVR